MGVRIMAMQRSSLLIPGLLVLLSLLAAIVESGRSSSLNSFNRYSFPKGFIFGTASSSYQYEGAINEGGREPSIWDTFTRAYPERNNMSNGDVALDFYHRYKEDIKLMKEINMDAFRLSISWSRILPRRRLSGGVNKEGVKFYRNLIDELLANGLQPFVTLFHWDLPQALEDEYGGFLNSQIIDDFRDFARICFEEFGDKVKLWATINEPWVYSIAGYEKGKKAPGRCSKWVNKACQTGNSSVEPYIVSHNLLLAHAAAVEEFRKCHKCQENRKIGIVLSPFWFEPHSDSLADKEATKRALDFMFGWHMNPITYGDYPHSMRSYIGDQLPHFTEEQSKMLKNSYDFVGINYYGALYAANVPRQDDIQEYRYTVDQCVEYKKDRNGIPIGPQAASDNILVYPEGIRYILNYTKENYNNPTIYISENGYDDFNIDQLPLKEALNDVIRKEYHEKHLQNLLKAIYDDGVDLKGYFAWSLMDNFEWNLGYSVRFGLYYVDYKNNLKRYPKKSAKWFKNFLKKRKNAPLISQLSRRAY